MPEIYRRRLPHHPLLGRHVQHDPRSRAYAVQPTATTLTAVRHQAHIGILDQGQLGSCTGNAGIGCLGADPFYATVTTAGQWQLTCDDGNIPPGQGAYATEQAARGVLRLHGGSCSASHAVERMYSLDETGAVTLYSDATKLDGYAGTYPPTDTGSDGLSVAKALKAAGIISSYLHAFTLQSALLQLMTTPLITGITWYNSMFDVGPDGVLTVDPSSGVAGGHELCIDEYRPATDTKLSMVGGPNSWGTSWGDGGRWYMTVADWNSLLADDGDVTAFVPATQPAPTPTPAPDVDAADHALWSATQHWTSLAHIGTNATAAHAVKTWAKAKAKGLA